MLDLRILVQVPAGRLDSFLLNFLFHSIVQGRLVASNCLFPSLVVPWLAVHFRSLDDHDFLPFSPSPGRRVGYDFLLLDLSSS